MAPMTRHRRSNRSGQSF